MEAVSVMQTDERDDPLVDPGPVKINLGCNQRPMPGYINVDIEPFAGVDVVADLEKPWPWPDNHADLIVTADLPEHLRMWWEEPDWTKYQGTLESLVYVLKNPIRHYGIIHFMNEAYRVLKTGGRLDATIPSSDGRGWAQDPTHVSYWNENSILYFTDPAFKNLYPHLIKCNWKALKVATTIPNTLQISWVRVVLEKV